MSVVMAELEHAPDSGSGELTIVGVRLSPTLTSSFATNPSKVFEAGTIAVNANDVQANVFHSSLSREARHSGYFSRNAAGACMGRLDGVDLVRAS